MCVGGVRMYVVHVCVLGVVRRYCMCVYVGGGGG